MQRRLKLLAFAACCVLGAGLMLTYWHHEAAARQRQLPLDAFERGPYRFDPGFGQRRADGPAPGPVIIPYVRPEFARQMRELRPAILAAAARHNRRELSAMSDHDFAVLIAVIMYNEHFGWFEERVTPVQALTPLYEDLQRETNATGISDLSVWPANIRPSVALEILRQQLPLPHGSATITVPITVAGSTIRPATFDSRSQLSAAITGEISDPPLAVEYLAANLERGMYRAHYEQVAVTWRALAAWHNQGIVAPADLRQNATASDYVRRASAYFATARRLLDAPLPAPTMPRRQPLLE